MSKHHNHSQTHLGHRARKRFGQNFLNDDGIIEEIVDAINPEPGENLIEIGPGLAALTEPVADRRGNVKRRAPLLCKQPCMHTRKVGKLGGHKRTHCTLRTA